MGLPLGIFLAWLVTKALSDQGVSFANPGKLLVYSSGSRSRPVFSPRSPRRAAPRG